MSITYGEWRRQERRRQRLEFMRLSITEQTAAWHRREAWLWTRFLQLEKQWVEPIPVCPTCRPSSWLTASSFPTFFKCACGVIVILDHWLPDGLERITMKTPHEVEEFARTGSKLDDLYDYPLEQRIKDLGLEPESD